MCPDGTKCRQGSPDAPDATSWGAWVQDAESRLGESGRNTPVSDAGHLFADVMEYEVISCDIQLSKHYALAANPYATRK